MPAKWRMSVTYIIRADLASGPPGAVPTVESHLRAAWLRSARNEGATSAISWPPPRTTGSSPPRLTSRLRRPVGLHSPGRACDGLDFGSPRSRSEFRCAGLVQEGGVSCGIPRQGSELGAQRHLSVCLGRVCE